MSALAEALLAAQRQAIGALSKKYLANRDDDATEASAALSEALDAIGCTDTVEQGYLLASLEYLRQLGAQAPTNGAAPKDARPASEAQWKLIRRLADERGQVAPDGPLTVDEASRAIEQTESARVMPRDAKYGRVTVEREPGSPFGDDEPVFLLRARDVTSGAVLAEYRRQSETYGAPQEHLAAIAEVQASFTWWQEAHADLVKVPD